MTAQNTLYKKAISESFERKNYKQNVVNVQKQELRPEISENSSPLSMMKWYGMVVDGLYFVW